MNRKDRSLQSPSAAGPTPSADRLLLEQIQRGDADAGHRFIRDYYPGVYRYLLYLTRSRDAAEDLTQETFLQAWRRLDTFEGRSALRTWLHRIAHREFLQALRSRRLQIALDAAGELPEAQTSPKTETAELRAILRKLPTEQRQIVVMHYLEGYEYDEIAQILGIPFSRVKHRLSEARARLQQELGEGDLAYLNEPSVPMRQWSWLPLDRMFALEKRLAPRGSGTRTEDEMERREFLRQAAAGAAGLMLSEPEKEIVDPRLAQKVTCAFKGTALSDLCEKLKTDTGIQVTAGPSVADEKVTLFCEKLPLREVMRQLSRPFGYTWLRSGTPGQYRYELVQDLRSQLLEEELRNRDRNAALLALEQEIERYRPYLELSPDEALARARTAPPAEKRLLEQLSGRGWGPIQLYFRLSPGHHEALRAGQTLKFSGSTWRDAQPLPGESAEWIESGVLRSQRDRHLQKIEGGFAYREVADPRGAPLATFSEAHALVSLTLEQTELGQFALRGDSGFLLVGCGMSELMGPGPAAVGTSPTAHEPRNRAAHARRAPSATVSSPVVITPRSDRPTRAHRGDGGNAPEPKVTTADVLEALHRATGLPIVSDFYTRLYPPDAVSVTNQSLADALDQLADRMRLRWNEEGNWLRFRSASFYHDRLKEVPNRLLTRWSAARRERESLTLDELVEIARLADAQLDGADMAEGAKEIWGLAEWDLARSRDLRPHLRFLGEFAPAQRREVASPMGLPFTRMSLSQQQRFLTLAFGPDAEPLQSLEELDGSAFRAEYTQPGWFQWRVPGLTGVNGLQYVLPVEWGRQGRRQLLPFIVERTRQAAQAVARPMEARVREALLEAERRGTPESGAAAMFVPEPQIVPTGLDLAFFYFPGASNQHPIYVRTRTAGYCMGTGW